MKKTNRFVIPVFLILSALLSVQPLFAEVRYLIGEDIEALETLKRPENILRKSPESMDFLSSRQESSLSTHT